MATNNKKKGKQNKKNLPVIIAICVVLIAAIAIAGVTLLAPKDQANNAADGKKIYKSVIKKFFV